MLKTNSPSSFFADTRRSVKVASRPHTRTHTHTHAHTHDKTQTLVWLQSITASYSLQRDLCVLFLHVWEIFPHTQSQFEFSCYFCSQSKQRESCGVLHAPFAPPAAHFEESFQDFGLQNSFTMLHSHCHLADAFIQSDFQMRTIAIKTNKSTK